MLQTRCHTECLSLKPASLALRDAANGCSTSLKRPKVCLDLRPSAEECDATAAPVCSAAGSTTSLPHYINAVAMLLPLFRRKIFFD